MFLSGKTKSSGDPFSLKLEPFNVKMVEQEVKCVPKYFRAIPCVPDVTHETYFALDFLVELSLLAVNVDTKRLGQYSKGNIVKASLSISYFCRS